MKAPTQALDELGTYTMSSRAPMDALARLAAAVGYEARGDRVQAEHHLGLVLGILSRQENHRQVSVVEVEGLLRLIFTIARGAPPQAPVRPARRLCAGRIVGPHGMIERCGRPAEDGEEMCAACERRHPRI